MTALTGDIEEYLLWLGVHNYAVTTIENRRRYLGYLDDFLTTRSVIETEDVTPGVLEDYQEHLFAHRKANGEPLSFATQAQRLIPVQQLFSWLRQIGRLPADPAADLTTPRPDRRLPESTLTIGEMAALLAQPDVTRPLGLRDRAVLEVFYSCALRRAELIDLTVRDVDVQRGTVFVRHGKGGKDRYVPIGERALFWVSLYSQLVRPRFDPNGDTDVLFLSTVGTPLCPDWLSRKVRRYLAAAGVAKGGSCHLLRHTVATLMLEGGADIRYVAEMLGHAKLETTQRYTRVSIGRLQAVHASCHPASGLSTAMASELCAILAGQEGLHDLVR
jgi:integrase/recombinase XerD